VICEAPAYPGAVPVFCSYQAATYQVEMDADGMKVDELEQAAGPPRRGGPEYFAEDRWREYIDSLCTIYYLRFEDLVGRIVDLALTRASGRVAVTAQEPGPPAR